MSLRCPRARLLRLAVWVALLLAPGSALALHRNLPFLLAVTQRPGTNVNASPSWGDPHWASFESTDDLLHNGSRGNQIFLWNAKIAAGLECQEGNVPGPVLREITRFPEGAQHPSTSESGRVVVFDSTRDLLGNGSTLHKIFMWSRVNRCFSDGPWGDPSGGDMIQLTDGSRDCTNPTINAQSINNTGYIVTYQCQGPSGAEIWVYNPGAPAGRPQFLMIGNGTNPRVNQDGGVVAFQSTVDLPADIVRPPQALGFEQIYVYNIRLDRRFLITTGPADSINPSPAQMKVGQTWPLIAFQSRADLLSNGSTGWQIFVKDPDTGELRQLTHGFGESTNPSLGGPGDILAFLSTEDLLGTGSFGQHIFFTDLRLGTFFDIASFPGASYRNPRAGGGNFIMFESTADMFRTGVQGWQSYLMDTWGRIPKPFIGQRNMRILEGGPARGSRGKMRSRLWHANGAFPPGGQMVMNIDFRDSRAEAPIAINSTDIAIPPVPLPDGAGQLCIVPTGNGRGTFDSDGGPPGVNAPAGNIVVTYDHDAPPCIGLCGDGGGVRTVGDYAPGGMVISLPVRVGVTQTLDGVRCPANVTRYEWSITTTLQLTTGTATGNIQNVDGIAGQTLTDTETGEPFQPSRMEQSNFAGAALVGVVPVLRVPGVPDGAGGSATQDVVVAVRLRPDDGHQYHPCQGIWCHSLLTCRADGDCNDSNACNGAETCHTGLNSIDDPDLCDGQISCTDLSCVAGPQVCDDGDACNGVETCDPAVGCTPGTLVTTCEDGALCTEDYCDTIRGCVSESIPTCCRSDADCTNGSLCDGNETCADMILTSTGPVTTGLAGDCRPGTPVVCTDNNACNGMETCDPASATCMPAATPLICDDGNVCTDDTCDPVLGCLHTANTNVFCDDGNPCTINDTCMNGLCAGTPVSCDDGNACNGFEYCDPRSGACVPGLPPFCDDGNPCTDDSCDATFGCLYTNNNNPCNDGTACTRNDMCINGTCTGTPVVCDDGNACNGVETCDPASGACIAGSPLICDDGNPCTTDTCDPVFGCLSTVRTGPCDDRNPCTVNDTCDNGICTGSAVICDDGNICNGIEFCDQATGRCLPGTPPSCDDGILCTTDTCDPAIGCVHSVTPSGTLCLIDPLLASIQAANPDDLGGSRRKNHILNAAQRVRTELSRASTASDSAFAGRRYSAAMRGLSRLEAKLRKGIFRWNFDLALTNTLIGEADALMSAVQGLVTG